MEKSDLYQIKEGDLGSTVANGLKSNFEKIVDEMIKVEVTGTI